jgi:hypothetical protein
VSAPIQHNRQDRLRNKPYKSIQGLFSIGLLEIRSSLLPSGLVRLDTKLRARPVLDGSEKELQLGRCLEVAATTIP